ncbi:uncharacterized protein [Cicer arietinum]|uniref:uncharacterized protein isoform X6 n=1 Tax=Cicer arietinum TaxID=3827 RepID=UPI003CC6922B
MVLLCAPKLSSTISLQKFVPFTSHHISTTPFTPSFLLYRHRVSLLPLLVCHAKKKIGFFDQILDYIEGGPKLRKWYGAPELLSKDGTSTEDDDVDDDYKVDDEVRDAVLVTDGDSEMGQMVILSLIVNKSRVKALVKDKRVALEAFGSYVESLAGDTSDNRFLKKALRGVRTIICPNEGFISSVGSLQGVKHVILLSQGCAASGSISKEDAAFVCVKALEFVPQTGFIFEVANGENKISDWKECLATLMEKASQQTEE